MDSHVKEIVRATTKGSEEGMRFPDVIKAMTAAGVERYHTDLIGATKTYYMPDGSFEIVSCHAASAPAHAFSAPAVEAAIRASQAGQISYPEFCERIAAAGCVGYIASFAGRSVLYYGRTNDAHLERFPGPG